MESIVKSSMLKSVLQINCVKEKRIHTLNKSNLKYKQKFASSQQYNSPHPDQLPLPNFDENEFNLKNFKKCIQIKILKT